MYFYLFSNLNCKYKNSYSDFLCVPLYIKIMFYIINFLLVKIYFLILIDREKLIIRANFFISKGILFRYYYNINYKFNYKM